LRGRSSLIVGFVRSATRLDERPPTHEAFRELVAQPREDIRRLGAKLAWRELLARIAERKRELGAAKQVAAR
jgi:hypothetical protein